VTREVGGQVFILMPDSTMHILENASAVFLFTHLDCDRDKGASIAELSEALVLNFQVSRDRAGQDVSDFVRDLTGLGILTARA